MSEFQLRDRLQTLMRWLFSSIVVASATYVLVKLKADFDAFVHDAVPH